MTALEPLERRAAEHDLTEQPVLGLGGPSADQRFERREQGIAISHDRRTFQPRGSHRSNELEWSDARERRGHSVSRAGHRLDGSRFAELAALMAPSQRARLWATYELRKILAALAGSP